MVILPAMRRLTQTLVLAAFIFSCGGHWCVLQGVAWASMIHHYSQMVPLAEAVSMTFSGKYPCELCKAIEEKQESERLQFFGMEKHEKKFFPPMAVPATELHVASIHYPIFLISFQARTEPPPPPPPRFA